MRSTRRGHPWTRLETQRQTRGGWRPRKLPASVQIDAWPGEPAVGALAGSAQNWGARSGLPPSQVPMAFTEPPDPKDWAHDDVGYGVLVADTPDRQWSKTKTTGGDLPEAVKRLLAARPKTQLLYWHKALTNAYLRRYYDDHTSSDHPIGLTTFGVAKNQLPMYVLIIGGPDRIPWSVQYSLSVRHAVGRLPFEDDADLGPYVDAMLDGDRGWASTPTDVTSPVVWTVDRGPTDITRLMRTVFSAPLVKAYTGTLAGLRAIDDAAATGAGLIKAMAAGPAVVVTSSHGATPLDLPLMRASLGLPVDATDTTVALADLTASMPAGAVWFSQACCSAGSAADSSYSQLLEPGSTARLVVDAVATLGSTVAPAPLALLRRPHPVRAVFGHVEPTFDWTLRDGETHQRLTNDLVTGLSTNLYYSQPLGLVLSAYRAGIGVLTTNWVGSYDRLRRDNDTAALPAMTRLRLTAWDRQSLVLLGDPTVRIPPLF
jgi:hypothetical protein